MKLLSILVLSALLLITGCTPIERVAYNTVVGAKAFLDSVKSKHPECTSPSVATLCIDLQKATSAKDLLIDAGEVYCSGSSFDTGGACQPPVKGSAAFDIAVGKLKAALAGYQQTEADLRGLL